MGDLLNSMLLVCWDLWQSLHKQQRVQDVVPGKAGLDWMVVKDLECQPRCQAQSGKDKGNASKLLSLFQASLNARKNNKLNFLSPKMARLGPPFLTQKSPGSPFWKELFPGGPNGMVWVGAKKVMLKKFMCFFEKGPLISPIYFNTSLKYPCIRGKFGAPAPPPQEFG